MSHQVLVVDDEARIRSILQAYLTADGFAVIEAGTGAEALELARLHAPDLVLLDIGLPDVDGLEVLRQLRTLSDMYVVLVTARADEVDTPGGAVRRCGRLCDQAVQSPRGRRPG